MSDEIQTIAILPEILLDGESPKVTYTPSTMMLHIETSKRVMDVPVTEYLLSDITFDVSHFIKWMWDNGQQGTN